jgi:cyanophycin synthetase
LRCWLATHAETRAPDGALVHVTAQGLYARARALALDSAVDAIVLVVQTGELLGTGLPWPFVDAPVHVDDALVSSAGARPLAAGRIGALLEVLAPHALPLMSC